MRRITPALLAALAALACGSDDDDDGNGGGGGGGGTQARLTATGTLAFQATEFTSVAQATTCEVPPGLDVGVAFAAVGASDQPGMCGYLQQGQVRQNARSITVVAVRLNPFGAATIAADTYPVVPEVTTQEKYAFVFVTQNDAACSPTDVVATGGSVVITSVEGGRIQGTVNATLEDGGTVSGTLDAPPCAVNLLAQGDVCSGDIGPAAPVCAP